MAAPRICRQPFSIASSVLLMQTASAFYLPLPTQPCRATAQHGCAPLRGPLRSCDEGASHRPTRTAAIRPPSGRVSVRHGLGVHGLRASSESLAPAVQRETGDQEMRQKLDREFVGISLPAFVQFAAEPLASLVDTMYLGRLGATALGAAGVAIGAQYSVSKLYNDPLLRTSISLVASGAGRAQAEGVSGEGKKEQLSSAVASALLLATIIGVVQALVYTVACSPIIRTMGVPVTSEMYAPAVAYLQVKALGTPGATMWLVVNGIFRGLGDTATPLKWALVFTGLNALLVPFCIFTLKMGTAGAAAGTSLAQYLALVPLLVKLNKMVGVGKDMSGLGTSLQAYVSSGVFMLVRTFGKIGVYTLCAREAALLGTVAAAAYNVVFQLGTATTQICESFAVAAQALLARELQGRDPVRKKTAVAGSRAPPHAPPHAPPDPPCRRDALDNAMHWTSGHPGRTRAPCASCAGDKLRRRAVAGEAFNWQGNLGGWGGVGRAQLRDVVAAGFGAGRADE